MGARYRTDPLDAPSTSTEDKMTIEWLWQWFTRDWIHALAGLLILAGILEIIGAICETVLEFIRYILEEIQFHSLNNNKKDR